MSKYGAYSDDFYSTVTLNTEMKLPSGRHAVMHYFEQLRKVYPQMQNFYCREAGEYILEEDKDQGHYRWSAVEPRRISSGFVNPPELEDAVEQHQRVFESIPHTLAASPLDCELLTAMFGFDFTYRGNHHELVADALGIVPAFEKLNDIPGARLVCNEPLIQFALDDECRVQFRLCVEPRTSPFHVRTGDYPEEQLSVFLAVRRYGSLETGETFWTTIRELLSQAQEIIDEYVIQHVLVPLQHAIAIK